MIDQALQHELDAWLSGGPGDGADLARLVARRLRHRGRAGLPTSALAEVTDRHQGHDPYLDAFLGSVLAGDPLALPLLERVFDDSGLDVERFCVLLLADVVRHENRHPDRRDPAAGRRRVRRAARCVWTLDRSLDADAPPPPSVATTWLGLTVLPASRRPGEYLAIRAAQVHELLTRVPDPTPRAGLLLRLLSDLVPGTVEVGREAVA
ncbi:hypothetical protein [Actinomycetospora aeridis]|uniref:Uncharacterized protein n=1 Tax=Actinomycetospora aeridis TaxID=3129231 RepID=A0ABU8N7R1_9PSEU